MKNKYLNFLFLVLFIAIGLILVIFLNRFIYFGNNRMSGYEVGDGLCDICGNSARYEFGKSTGGFFSIGELEIT